MDSDEPADIAGLAREALGIDRLRPEPRQAAEAAANGRDVLAVLPTGGGETAIYQLDAGLLTAEPDPPEPPGP